MPATKTIMTLLDNPVAPGEHGTRLIYQSHPSRVRTIRDQQWCGLLPSPGQAIGASDHLPVRANSRLSTNKTNPHESIEHSGTLIRVRPSSLTLDFVSLSGSSTKALISSRIQLHAVKCAPMTASLWGSSSSATLSARRTSCKRHTI